MIRWGIAVAITLLLQISGSLAFAGVFITTADDPVQATHYRALVSHDGDKTTVIQTITLRNQNRRFVWLKPFPVTPEIIERPRLSFKDLERRTEIAAPFNQTVRDDLFGPSNVTLLIENLKTPTAASGRPKQTPRPLRVLETQVFEGQIQTSTITRQMILPSPMRAWFNRRGYPIPERVKASMAGHLNRGWVVVAVELEDRNPNVLRIAQTPPIEFRFASTQPLFPLMRQPTVLAAEPTFDLWVLAAQRMVSATYPTNWIERPWSNGQAQRGRFVGVFSQAMTARDPLTEVLDRQFELRLPPSPQLVQHRFQHQAEVWQELAFMPAIRAPDLPGIGARGGMIDVFLCLLLGLTPLLFTPESWFLLWLSARRRPNGRRWPNLWPYYALVVASYWLVTLDGVGRVAAVLPLIVGVWQLLWPLESEQSEFVRVQFKRQAKASS